MWSVPNDRRPFIAFMVGLIVLAWLALWFWGHSPYGRFLSHEDLGEVGESGTFLVLFVTGWTVMIVAMMLPTSLPLVMLVVMDSLPRREVVRK